jgi:alpha-L-arabinofuranosidase
MRSFCGLVMLLTVLSLPISGAEPTLIKITDKVVVKDCVPFGLNLTNYGNNALTKDRIAESFEGSTYRQCLTGYIRDETGMSVWVGTSAAWRDIHIGSKFTILNGASKGESGIVKDIIKKTFKHQGRDREFTYYVFDRKMPADPKPSGLPGLMIEKYALDEGSLMRFRGDPSNFWFMNGGKKDVLPRLEIQIGDVPPDLPGQAACRFIAPTPGQWAHLRYRAMVQGQGQANGAWKISFWAKALKGKPAIETLATFGDPAAPTQKTAPGAEWQKYEFTMDVKGVPEPNWSDPSKSSTLYFIFRVSGGEVLIDEIRAEQAAEKNPTVFRDDLVAVLKEMNVGSVRHLQMGGSTLDNILLPRHQSHRYAGQRGLKAGPNEGKSRHMFSIHELFELCEYIGADPWYCLPGTFNATEMKNFMEYLGGPVDSKYGSIRAKLGHPKPWTDVFRFIHVEFGNEAWNSGAPYHSGGFGGSDYWRDLIAVGKASPYNAKNVIFQPAGQSGNPNRSATIMRDAPNGDMFSLAPYMMMKISKENLAFLDTKDKFYRWLLAWPLFRSRDPRGVMYQNHAFAKKAGYELSTYEFHHHTLKAPHISDELLADIFTSQVGGLNFINSMLVMLKDHGIRVQNAFALTSSYNWGFVKSMRADKLRYRPTGLSLIMVNKVLAGDLLETEHAADQPTFDSAGAFFKEWQKPEQLIPYPNIPCIASYAFRDGKKRGVILVNLDLKREITTKLEFTGGVQDAAAVSYLLSAARPNATNSWAHPEPQVKIREEKLADFASGAEIALPPCSLRVIAWSE